MTSQANMSRRTRLLAALLCALILPARVSASDENICPDVFAKLASEPIKRASIAKRIASASALTFVSALEPLVVVPAMFRKTQDRRIAAKLISGAESPVLSNKAIPEVSIDGGWEYSTIWISKRYGSALRSNNRPASLDALKVHFRAKFGERLGSIASSTIDQFNNRAQVLSWAQSVRKEMSEVMEAEKLSAALQSDPRVRELYLDKVLAKRAAAHGFKIADNELPYNVVTFNPISFFQGMLGRRRLFIDWTGADLTAGGSGEAHYARGHLLAMTYAAEHVPGFSDLMVSVGKSGDRHGLWSMLFDNTDSTITPFWSGYWVNQLGPGLGIRY